MAITNDHLSITFPIDLSKLDAKSLDNRTHLMSHIANQYVKQSDIDIKSGDLAHFYLVNLLDDCDEHLQLDSSNNLAILDVNRSWLAPFSYFETVLNSGMLESQQSKIKMESMDLLDCLHAYDHGMKELEFSKCKLCCLSHNKLLFRMLDTLVYLQADLLFQNAVDFLIKNMSKHSCVEGLIWGQTFSHSNLKSTSFRFCLHNADFVIKNYLSKLSDRLSEQLMRAYINHPQLNLRHEMESLKILQEHGILRQKPDDYVSQRTDTEVLLETSAAKDKDDEPHLTVSIIDLEKPNVKLLELSFPAPANSRRNQLIGASFCASNEHLYLVGGEFGLGRGTWNTTIYQINTLSRIVTREFKMPEKRRSHFSCCSSVALYIFGGVDWYRVKRSELFRIDLETGESEMLCKYDDAVDSVSVSQDDSLLYIRFRDELIVFPTDSTSGKYRKLQKEDTTASIWRMLSFAETWNLASGEDYNSYMANRQLSGYNVTLTWYQD